MPPGPHISVCICTYRRPEWLKRLLGELQKQHVEPSWSSSIVVADNDPARSAKPLVEAIAGSAAVRIAYCCEPVKNIALVRNRAIAQATGDWIALIDDDEFPVPDWLRHLYQTCVVHGADGALGPVRPHFEQKPPAWVIRSGLYHRPEHPTGFVMPWHESRTGNVLFRRQILSAGEPPFSPEFSNGGEDQDFFHRQVGRGRRFVWCSEAIAYETVSPLRWNMGVMVRRALLRGKNSLKHSGGIPWHILKSAVAVPAYALLLPLVGLGGMHLFMRCLIKLCDHLGKLLAIAHLNWVRDRAG